MNGNPQLVVETDITLLSSTLIVILLTSDVPVEVNTYIYAAFDALLY